MNKKTKFLIVTIIFFILIGLIFGINTICRFYKLQNILSRVEENVEKDNFYLETTINNKGITSVTKSYYKGNVGKFISQNGVYTWYDGEKAYSVDENNKEIIILDLEKNIGLVNKKSFAALYPCYTKNFFERLVFAGDISNKFKTEYYNGEKCILIQIKEDGYTKSFWITEKFKDLVKAKVEFANGDIYEYKYKIQFHTTKLKDIELPDISEYKVINQSSGEELKTNTLENNVKLESQNIIIENTIIQENDKLEG